MEAFLDRHDIDVLALQETKAREDQLPLMGLQAAGYDVKIWNGMKPDGGGAYSKYDKLVLKYRAFYRGWVDRVASER